MRRILHWRPNWASRQGARGSAWRIRSVYEKYNSNNSINNHKSFKVHNRVYKIQFLCTTVRCPCILMILMHSPHCMEKIICCINWNLIRNSRVPQIFHHLRFKVWWLPSPSMRIPVSAVRSRVTPGPSMSPATGTSPSPMPESWREKKKNSLAQINDYFTIFLSCHFEATHSEDQRATPKLFALYQTSLYYYDIVNKLHNDTEEAIAVQSNTVNDRRNKYLTFVCSNNYRQGLNSISNRLRSVSNMIEKSWPTLAHETFKLKCKINIIQAGLLLLWCSM